MRTEHGSSLHLSQSNWGAKEGSAKTQVVFPENWFFGKEWLAPELGDIRKDIKYAHSSVLLRRKPTQVNIWLSSRVRMEPGHSQMTQTSVHTSPSRQWQLPSPPGMIRLFVLPTSPSNPGPTISLKDCLQLAKGSGAGLADKSTQ